MRRLLAIDYGEKRIGLALSDPLQLFAKPLKVLPNTGFESFLQQLLPILQEYNVEQVIVGMPYAIDGGNTAKTDETQAFLENLKERLNLPVIPWDERYSTSEAVEELKKLGYDWKQRRSLKDAMAAALILTSYLSSRQ